VTSLEFRDRLARRARRAKAPLTIAMLDPLEDYYRLLAHWNAKINLTALPLDAPTDETFDRLLVEPIAASRRVKDSPATWLDLGSGGGSPAIPMKIARPALSLTMVESKERKSAFLREATRALGLADTYVVTSRFEELAEDPERISRADLITVRAVKADDELYSVAGRLLRPGGELLMFRPAHAASRDPGGFERATTVPLVDLPPSFLTVFVRRPA
jgi:16S rRNA (guanine527-N7)-methyltransferase